MKRSHPEDSPTRPIGEEIPLKKINRLRLCLKHVPADFSKDVLARELLDSDFPIENVHMPANTWNHDKRFRLAFIDFREPWMARIAMRLINLMNCHKITADFAYDNKENANGCAPKLTEQRTMFSDGSVPEMGICAYCRESDAKFVCTACFTLHSATFYCNLDHQTQDWYRHKPDCKPLPHLAPSEVTADKINQDIESSRRKKFYVPFVPCFQAGDEIVITHVATDGGVLYVRPVNGDFQALENQIKKYASTAAKITEKPSVGDTILAPFENNFLRAQVVDTFEPDHDGNEIRCFLLDYGQSFNYNWRSLKKLSYTLRSTPRHTFKVILDDCGYTDTAKLHKLISLCDQQSVLEVVKLSMQNCERYVKLKIRGQDETVNENLRRVGLKRSLDERIIFSESDIMPLKIGSSVEIRVTDATYLQEGFVSCMPKEQYSAFWKKSKEIQDYGNTKAPYEPYEPIPNELCLVKPGKHGDRWERGAVVSFDQHEAKIMLIDKCLFKRIPKDHIRRLPAIQDFTTGFFTQLCFIQDLTEKNLSTAEEFIRPRANIIADADFTERVTIWHDSTFPVHYELTDTTNDSK